MGRRVRGVSRSENTMDTTPPVEDTGTRLIPPEERDYSQSPVVSGGPQASQIPDFQGMPPPRHGCSPGSSEDCCPDKETVLLA